jgi:hypothetical protein
MASRIIVTPASVAAIEAGSEAGGADQAGIVQLIMARLTNAAAMALTERRRCGVSGVIDDIFHPERWARLQVGRAFYG